MSKKTLFLAVMVAYLLNANLNSEAMPILANQITALTTTDQYRSFPPSGASNPLVSPSRPLEAAILSVSSHCLEGILPNIPNLQVGYIYTFGNNAQSGRLTLDYLLPVNLNTNSVVFGEAHSEWQDYWNTQAQGLNQRIDISMGGGWRKIIHENLFVGINGFFDTAKIDTIWYQSGSAGLEMAELIRDFDVIDLNFNCYGRLFEGSLLRNAFRYGPSNFDVETGYSHQVWENGPDLRLKFAAYKQDIGESVYGLTTGAELTSQNGLLMVKYEYGRDKVNGDYHSFGTNINCGLQLEKLFNGELPLTLPEPLFRSPRNFRRLLSKPVVRSTSRQWAEITSSSGKGGKEGNRKEEAQRVVRRIGNSQTIQLSHVNGGFPRFANFTAPPVTNAELRATKNTRITLTITSPTGFTFNNNTLLVGIRDNAKNVNVGVDIAHAISPNTTVGTTPITTTLIFNDPTAAQTLAAAGGGTGICDIVFLAGVFGPVSTTPPIMYWQATVDFLQ